MSKKFASIWGDLTVGSVTPATEPSEEEKKAAEEAEAKKAEEEAVAAAAEEQEEEEENSEEETAEEKAAREKAAEEAAEAAKEDDPIEYEEDDVNKAFTILLDEGVLDEADAEEFEATPEGFADAVSSTVRKKFQEELSKIPQTVQNFYAHVIAGNDPAEFKPKKEIVWADADVTDEDTQKASLRQLYVNQGMTIEEADEEIEDVEAAGKLEKKAGIAIASLTTLEEKRKKTEAEEAAKAQTKAEKAQQAEIDGINKLIDESDEFAGFKLDDKKRKGFKDYLFKVQPRSGKTQLQINMADEERKLKVAFLDFVEYNKEDLKKEVGQELTKKRKKKLSRFTSKNAKNTNGSRTVSTPGKSENKGSIKFPTMFGAAEVEVED